MHEMKEMRVRSLGQEDLLEEEMATPLQYSCLENPMDRGAWRATAHGVSKNGMRLSTWAHALETQVLSLPLWLGGGQVSGKLCRGEDVASGDLCVNTHVHITSWSLQSHRINKVGIRSKDFPKHKPAKCIWGEIPTYYNLKSIILLNLLKGKERSSRMEAGSWAAAKSTLHGTDVCYEVFHFWSVICFGLSFFFILLQLWTESGKGEMPQWAQGGGEVFSLGKLINSFDTEFRTKSIPADLPNYAIDFSK